MGVSWVRPHEAILFYYIDLIWSEPYKFLNLVSESISFHGPVQAAIVLISGKGLWRKKLVNCCCFDMISQNKISTFWHWSIIKFRWRIQVHNIRSYLVWFWKFYLEVVFVWILFRITISTPFDLLCLLLLFFWTFI